MAYCRARKKKKRGRGIKNSKCKRRKTNGRGKPPGFFLATAILKAIFLRWICFFTNELIEKRN
jgi:hypothetical protein